MTAKFGVEKLRYVADFLCKGPGFDRVTKMLKITEGGNGRLVGEFTLEAEHLNGVGNMHGGLTAAILDNVTTWALMSKGSHFGVSTSLTVNYLSGAKAGDVIEVDAITVHAGRKMAYIECILRRKSDGKIIAKGGQNKFVDLTTYVPGLKL